MFKVGVAGRIVPKDAHALIFRSYEYIITWKKKIAEVVKDIKKRRLAHWAQCITYP